MELADGDVLVDTEHTLRDGTRVRLFAVESSGYPGGVNYRFQYDNPETGGSLLRYDNSQLRCGSPPPPRVGRR